MKRFLIPLIIVLSAMTAFSMKHLLSKEDTKPSLQEYKRKWEIAKPDLSKLKTGDLIFRHGRGFISDALIKFGSREQRYSHVGIVSMEKGSAFVYHAIGGEENPSSTLRKEPVESFCQFSEAYSFGIYRTDLNEGNLQAVDSLSKRYFNDKLQFDTKFDLNTDDKMYCTEFVYKIFQSILGQKSFVTSSILSGKQYIACDNLYLNSHTRLVYQYQY